MVEELDEEELELELELELVVEEPEPELELDEPVAEEPEELVEDGLEGVPVVEGLDDDSVGLEADEELGVDEDLGVELGADVDEPEVDDG